jgi:hypothetical protein
LKERNEMHIHASAKIYYYIETLARNHKNKLHMHQICFSFCTQTKWFSQSEVHDYGLQRLHSGSEKKVPERKSSRRRSSEDRVFCELAPSPDPK